MKEFFKCNASKRVATFCLWILCLQSQAGEWVEISVEIETYGYRLGDIESINKAKPRTVTVDCIVGSNQWSMMNDFQQPEQWLFDGTNVLCRTQTPQLREPKVVNEAWESRDGHPMGHFGVNIPCSKLTRGSTRCDHHVRRAQLRLSEGAVLATITASTARVLATATVAFSFLLASGVTSCAREQTASSSKKFACEE